MQQQHAALSIGVVGLGVGTIASYARPSDTICFYELHPEVERLARKHFTFLERAAGRVEVVLGDARVSLERESPRGFDLLVLDAFSGDAVPTHLLSREAFAVYQRHLRPGGVIAVHISNRHVRLDPVVMGAAIELEMFPAFVVEDQGREPGHQTSRWALLVQYPSTFAWQPLVGEKPLFAPRDAILWTDDRSNLFELLQ